MFEISSRHLPAKAELLTLHIPIRRVAQIIPHALPERRIIKTIFAALPRQQDGDALEEVALILSGNLHLAHADAAGNSNLMDVLGPGDTLGVLNAVGGYRLHSTITAATAAEMLFFRVDKLLRANRLTDPGQIRFVQNLTLAVAQKAQRLTKKLEDSIRRTTRERLQDYLSAQYHKAGSRTFVIPLNRQDLADFLFVDRSAMSNELCKMRDEGLLKFEKSRFELLVQMPITDHEPDPNEE